jgi:hypothetical protein
VAAVSEEVVAAVMAVTKEEKAAAADTIRIFKHPKSDKYSKLIHS